ncbi:MAG: PepSY-like domain-containing protein [Phycisphaerae bacterium]|nr:PepSY-like domain-containing protein [Phycisphaerae bacterium]
MQRMFQSVLAVIVIVAVTGCCCPSKQGEKAEEGEKKEAPAQQVSLSQVPEPARATIVKLTAAGKIKKIEKAEEDGKTVYDVEATVQGRDVEYDIAADGTVLTTEQSVPYASLPLVVRNAAQKYFGSATGLKTSVEVEDGKTFYEVEGKNGKALKLSDTGRIVEEEKQ